MPAGGISELQAEQDPFFLGITQLFAEYNVNKNWQYDDIVV